MPAEKQQKINNWVIRIPRSDDPNEFVLVHISPSGKTALDLKFIATEGENPYVGSLKQSRLKDIRSKNFQGTQQEFEQIIASVLKVKNDDAVGEDIQHLHADIETTASIREAKGDEGNELVIAIRKRIDSITQRVASFTLQQNDDQTIELFEWMGITLSQADTYTQQISALTTQLATAEKSIQDLKGHLDDLVQSKKDHETMLVTNFAQILNEKKLKIRNQQRLLAGANVDPEKVRELQEGPVQHDQAHKSRRGKRKATLQQEQEEDIDDDEFEKMDIDEEDKTRTSRRKPAATTITDEEDEDEERPETPQPLEEETESEAEGEPSIQQRETEQGRGEPPNLAKNAAEPPPPRRDLPFLRKSKKDATDDVHAEVAAGADEGTAGETDDDEL